MHTFSHHFRPLPEILRVFGKDRIPETSSGPPSPSSEHHCSMRTSVPSRGPSHHHGRHSHSSASPSSVSLPPPSSEVFLDLPTRGLKAAGIRPSDTTAVTEQTCWFGSSPVLSLGCARMGSDQETTRSLRLPFPPASPIAQCNAWCTTGPVNTW